MPRYNLNHQDVETLVSGLFHLALNAESTKEHTRITNLRDRLLNKINEDNSSQDQSSDDDSDIDVWDAFK
jgi:hypothetical protein